MQDNNQNSGLLDELGEEQRQQQDQQQQLQQQLLQQVEAINPVIEKMKAYASEVEARGQSVEFSCGASGESDEEPAMKYWFSMQESRSQVESRSSSDIKSHLAKALKDKIEKEYYPANASSVEFEDLDVFNDVVFKASPNAIELYYYREYSAEVYYSYRNMHVMSKPSKVTVESGVIEIRPNGFAQGDVETCFKFLLGRADKVKLSENATIKTTEGRAGGKTGPCFIATAVYASETAPEVLMLRNFRDNFLLSSKLGRACMNLYYLFSPPVARLLEASLSLRNIVQKAIVQPIVNLVQSKFYIK